MVYVLLLSFEYHRYHHDAIMRVYADNTLIDEQALSKDIKIRPIDYTDMPPGWITAGPKNYRKIKYVPEKLFLFEIDKSKLNDKITVEIINDQNNHTNGFMTEYSYIRFHDMFLLPKCLLDYKNWKSLTTRYCVEFASKSILKDSDRNSKYGTDRYFPPVVTEADIIVKNSTDDNKVFGIGYKKGGSFTIDIPTNKKHNFIHFGKSKPGRIMTLREPQILLWAFNALNIGT